ncbi:MAG: orotate phosphoribosyltransferase [Acidobacteria bacterium]|nr:orotate phosphoribosyltransferase [Acidobacteriota bacterium]MCI0722741.1 orotate phosphoribosyltransferase [Acidobacteriota bacterium]
MDSAQIARIFEETGALLTGHFLLTSGLHSENYLQCAKVLQWPHHAEACAQALAAHFAAEKPGLVIAPAIGGIVIGQEVGRALGCRAIFAERESGALCLRRGFVIGPGERAVVVEDVITTGGSTRETMEVVRAHGGKVLGALSVIDRSGGEAALGARYHSLWTLYIPTYKAEECPLCKAGSSPVKPGSRK